MAVPLSRKGALLLLPLVVLLNSACPAAAAAARTPKHILMFIIDDYGFADASYKNLMYNGTAAPPTPTIDELALAGVRLESHYSNKLCSPTRTALLSGRYAYTIGMDDGVIVDGQNIDMPLNLLTIADHLQQAGWNTSAYGKWDAGMTTWGSTPSCRGFDNFQGFYSAASDYYTHMVGPGFDYHCDAGRSDEKGPDFAASTVYTTTRVTSAVEQWITAQVEVESEKNLKQAKQLEARRDFSFSRDSDGGHSELKTFAYVAHEAVHGPLEVPQHYIEGECEKMIPASYPVRLIYCGMVRAMDESVRNITDTYKRLGLWNDTLVILTGDNGGIPADGGNNYPLRGNKATTFEGGLRSLAFISGAGLSEAVKGTVSNEMMHVTDWLPTLVAGVAGVDLPANMTGRACPTCTRPVAPLDGVNQWSMLSSGAPSARTEVLLDLQTTACNGAVCNIPGSGAIRMGKWKLLHGHQSVFPTVSALGVPHGLNSSCVARDSLEVHKKSAIDVPTNESNPWCPLGWTPPPRSDGQYELPKPPPDIGCDKLPCFIDANSPYIAGQTMLFDVVADPFEWHDVAAANPAIVKQLLGRLQYFNSSHCGGQRCEADNAGGALGVPVAVPDSNVPAWLPWRGDPKPSACDTDRTVPSTARLSSL